nr:uncharacterized protein LOC113827880 [Penaeus vannamei]
MLLVTIRRMRSLLNIYQRNKFLKVSDSVTSLRYVGVGDLHIESITLYRDYEAGGAELLLLVREEECVENFSDVTSSIAIVGPSPWTLYEDAYFMGRSACFVPSLIAGSDVSSFGYFSFDSLGYPNNAVSAVRRGCHSTNVKVYHP